MKWSYCFLQSLTEQDLLDTYNLLEDDRKEHIDRLKQPADRSRSLAGELLIKKLLSESFGISSPVICRGKNGQPFVKDSNVFISITHSDSLIAVAADLKPVGIDAEKIKPYNLKLIERVCCDEEKAYVLSDNSLTDRRFCEIWTAKEAYFKRQGTGITDFKSVNILSLDRHIFDLNGYLIQII